MNLRRLIVCLYLALFLGLSVTAGVYFLHAKEEYNRLKSIELKNRQYLAAAEIRLADQEKRLERLRTDPYYVEKVIRQKLGYTKPAPGEEIFRFDP